MKKTALLIGLTMVGCVGLSSLAMAEAESGTLSFSCQETDLQYWERVVERFNAEYPDVQIEFTTFADYTAQNQGVMAAHQAGDDFDLCVVNHVDMLTFVKGEILYPLSELADAAGVDIDSIILGDLNAMGKLGDVQYTIPIDTDTRVMMYNTDLFEKYGLELPRTLDDMLEAGKVIAEADQGDYIFVDEMCQGGDYFSTYETGIFLQSFGGKLYDVDSDGVATATIDTEEMRNYLNFIMELLPLMPENSTTIDNARDVMLQGNIGMYTFGPWEFGLMDLDNIGFNYEILTVPEGPAGSVSTSGGYQLGIGSGSENVDLAWTFINFLLNDSESMSIIGESGLPTVEGAYDSGVFADAKYDVFKEQLESSNLPQVPVANLGEVVSCFAGYWNDMCCGNLTVDEVIEQAQPAVQALLDENNE